ncbi:Rne/Rng family ribonuclease [Prauserella oleivorans]
MSNAETPAENTGGTTATSTAGALADLPNRVRVHALAKLLGSSSREVLATLADLGETARSAQSSVPKDVALKVARAVGALDEAVEEAQTAGEPVAQAPDTTENTGGAPEPEPAAEDVPAAQSGVAGEAPEASEASGSPCPERPRCPARPRRSPRRPRRVSRSRPPPGRSRGPASPVVPPAVAPAVPAAEQAEPVRTPPPVHTPVFAAPSPVFLPPEPVEDAPAAPKGEQEAEPAEQTDEQETGSGDSDQGGRRRRRRGRRGRGRGKGGDEAGGTDERGESEDGEVTAEQSPKSDKSDKPDTEDKPEKQDEDEQAKSDDSDDTEGEGGSRRRRRRRRRKSGGDDNGDTTPQDDPPNTVVHVRDAKTAETKSDSRDGVRSVRGSTRLEAKRQRRRDGREAGRRRAPILSEAEFLARRESVERTMVVAERGDSTQIGVLEDGVLVEHFVTSQGSGSIVGNVYLGRVQNVLPSMEAAFIDIGRGRNAVLYAGEVDWDAAGLEGKARKIEQALSTGDNVLVQVTKDPVGHKGARLTTQISLPGRFLVYVPAGGATGISRKLPENERRRLKDILKRIVPEDAGVIIRTASEGISEEELARDVRRLQAQWEVIKEKAESSSAKKSNAPVLLYEEPDLLVKVVRDLFTEDFAKLEVQGDTAWETISAYVEHVAPDLMDRVKRYVGTGDVFADYRIDEQITKALDRKVWLPSGGYLVIDRTEAMTVIDVNTGKFTGSGGNLEETVTRNNLESAEEIVRQLRLRDIGGIIVIDFIDMVLESNRELVLRRLTECLGRDRTRHQVAEVTSLGLVQMTRKRVGTGLLEAFSTTCEHCKGRGVIVSSEPQKGNGNGHQHHGGGGGGRRRGRGKGEDTESAKPSETGPTPEQRESVVSAVQAMANASKAAKQDDAEASASGDTAGGPEATPTKSKRGDRRTRREKAAAAKAEKAEKAAAEAAVSAGPGEGAADAEDAGQGAASGQQPERAESGVSPAGATPAGEVAGRASAALNGRTPAPEASAAAEGSHDAGVRDEAGAQAEAGGEAGRPDDVRTGSRDAYAPGAEASGTGPTATQSGPAGAEAGRLSGADEPAEAQDTSPAAEQSGAARQQVDADETATQRPGGVEAQQADTRTAAQSGDAEQPAVRPGVAGEPSEPSGRGQTAEQATAAEAGEAGEAGTTGPGAGEPESPAASGPAVPAPAVRTTTRRPRRAATRPAGPPVHAQENS